MKFQAQENPPSIDGPNTLQPTSSADFHTELIDLSCKSTTDSSIKSEPIEETETRAPFSERFTSHQNYGLSLTGPYGYKQPTVESATSTPSPAVMENQAVQETRQQTKNTTSTPTPLPTVVEDEKLQQDYHKSETLKPAASPIVLAGQKGHRTHPKPPPPLTGLSTSEPRVKTHIPIWVIKYTPRYTEELWHNGKLTGTNLASFVEGLGTVTQQDQSRLKSLKITLQTPFLDTIVTILNNDEDSWVKAKESFLANLKKAKTKGNATKQKIQQADTKILIEPFYEEVEVSSTENDEGDEEYDF